MVKKNLLINKVVLITGASSGLGKTFANFFLSQNAQVVVCARRSNLLKKFYKGKRNVYFKKVDLTNPLEIRQFIKIIYKKFKKIDVLINNAAIAEKFKVEKTDYKKLKKAFEVNLFAPTLLIKECLKTMKKNNYGRIINVSSGGSVNCAENFFSYSATKAAVNTLTRTLSKEVGKYNIKVNTMSPGPCKTEMFPENKLSTKLSLPTIEYLATLPKSGPTGEFFWFMKKINIFSNLNNINWGKPPTKKV